MRRKIPPFRHLRHAYLMVIRNLRAYAKLSVTVVLSFTILLAFMAISDASLFNQYYKVMSLPREIVQCYIQDNVPTFRSFLNQMDAIPDTQYYSYFESSTPLNSYDAMLHANCFFIPRGIRTMYAVDASATIDPNRPGLGTCAEPIPLLGEKQDFFLEPNQAIVNETFYNSLVKGGATEPVHFPLTFYWEDGSYSVWEMEVVGVCKDLEGFIRMDEESGKVIGYVTIFLSQEQLSQGKVGEFSSVRHIAFVSSTKPEQVMSVGNALGMAVQGVARAQAEAQEAIRASIRSKAVTAAVMLILLAINLYSSFSNVLSTRSFEIGVKRAIGASKWELIRQFMYEALLVLGADTVLSMLLVGDGMIVYKTVQKVFQGREWIAYISPYSIAIYVLCSIGLTVSFSLLFAYQTTKVEIVQQLKAE